MEIVARVRLLYGTGGVSYGEYHSESTQTAIFIAREADRVFGGGDAQWTNAESLPDGCVQGPDIFNNGGTNNDGSVTCTRSQSQDEFRIGYAVGGGIDFLATNHFNVGVEAMYVNLGTPDFTPFDDNQLDFVTLMGKATFRFGSGFLQ